MALRWDTSKIFGGLMMAGLVALGLGVAGNAVKLMMAPTPPGIGEAAPEFSLSALGTDAPAALSDHAGDVVLLEFWTSACVGCLGATPKLNRLHERYRTDGFAVVSVNMDGDDGADARAVVKKRRIVYPVLMDPGEVASRYGVYATPTAILVDAQGVIRAVHRGNVTEDRLDQEIRALLARRRAAQRNAES